MIDVPQVLFIFHVAMATTIHAATSLFEGFSQVASPVVVTALWQGAIVAIGLAMSLRLARRVSAGHRFAIWAAGFAALVCLPFLPILTARAAGAAATQSMAGAASSGGPWLRLDLRWSLAIGAVWIAASIFRAVALGVHSLRLRKLWKTARPIEDDGLAGIEFAGGSRRGAQVCTTKELDRPAVIGFLAPRILIPEWLFERLTPEELEHVILHESEHLRRGDDWINLVQKLCLLVFPLHPALAWMERRLCSEREMACDEGVVRATKAPRAYAACLASLAERGLKHRPKALSDALSLGAWQRRPELVQRVHRILRRTPGLSPLATRALVGAMSCGLVFGSIEFARCPQLVAFVPAPRAAVEQSAAAQLGDARYVDASYGLDKRNAAPAGFRAIDAVAQMPAATGRASGTVTAQHTSAKQSATAQRSLKTASQAAPREVLLKAEMPSASAERREEQAQTEWIIFTAWEQVENSGSGHRGAMHDAGVRQDYDSVVTDDGATGDGGSQTDENSGSESGRATITQLIFRIYPAGALVGSQFSGSAVSGSAVSGSPNSGSSEDQPVAIPLRDGWFVFQL